MCSESYTSRSGSLSTLRVRTKHWTGKRRRGRMMKDRSAASQGDALQERCNRRSKSARCRGHLYSEYYIRIIY